MNFFARAAAWTLAAPVAYSFWEPHRLVVRRFEVAFDELPVAAEGMRVAHISDLHHSAITGAGIVRNAVRACNAEQPNAVVLTGDYVSRRNSYSRLTLARSWARPITEYADEVARELSALRAPDGVFAVPGNHDCAGGRFDAIEALLRAAGITTLVNKSVLLRAALPVVGLDDLRAGRPHIERACRDVAAQQAHIVLSHNPRVLPLLAARNCLVLAGHTHGGQVHLPCTRFRRRPADMRGSPLFQGWHRAGAARLYISSGVGSVHFPMRFGCPPEIAVFTLRSADQSAALSLPQQRDAG